MFSTIYNAIFVTTVIIVGCYPLYTNWRLYRIFLGAGEQARGVGFFWFSFYMQAPGLSGSQKTFEDLPEEIRQQVMALRNQQRWSSVALVLWIFFLISVGTLVRGLPHGVRVSD